MAKPDYSGARWYVADSNNYQSANRPDSTKIDKIIVHITQGSWSSAINWFDDPRAGVSAHYVVRSSDGFIGQCVQEKDISYHAGDWSVNQTSVGIEHEGYGDEPGWLTDSLYEASAKLSAYLADKYGIPVDRDHFLGHKEVSSTQCPGSYWDWDRYLRLVRSYAEPSEPYEQIVDNADGSRFKVGGPWESSSYSSQRWGSDYRYANPTSNSNSTDRAMFKIRIPSAGKYRIWARWPASSGYNRRTRFLIKTSGGWSYRLRDQRVNGGKWVVLGDFNMDAGDNWWVKADRRSPASGYVIADAVMVREA